MKSISENLRRNIIVLCGFMLMFLIFATSISCMGIYLKPVSESFGITRTQFSLTTTIGSVAMMISAIIAGKLVGKINIKVSMTAGIIMSAMSMMIYSVADSINVFYFAAILMGTAVSFTCNMPISVLINEWFADGKSGTALGIAFVGSGAGAMVLNPLYSYIIETYGWRISFRVAALCVVLLVIPILLFVKEKGLDTDERISVIKTDNRISLSDVMKLPAMWCIFVGFVLISLANMAVLNHGVPYMTDNGVDAVKAASFISMGSAALIIGKIVLGRMIDRFGIYKATVFGTIMMLICILSMWMTGIVGNTAIVGFIIGYGLGAGVATVSMPGVISHMFGNCDFGAIMGFFCTTGGIGGILQIFISMVYDKTGNYNIAWIVVSAIAAVTILLFVFMLKPQYKKADTD